MDFKTPPNFGLSAYSCPNCGVYAKQEWHDMALYNKGYSGVNKDYGISTCDHCQEIAIWHDKLMVYPLNGEVPIPNRDMPEEIRDLYFEAKKVIVLSPRSSAALLRLGLTKLVAFLGEDSNDVDLGIANLANKGLPQNLSMALESVRFTGPNKIRGGVINFDDTTETAYKLFIFINIICENQITQPNIIAKYMHKFNEENEVNEKSLSFYMRMFM